MVEIFCITSYMCKIVVRNQTSGVRPSGLSARREIVTGMGTAGIPAADSSENPLEWVQLLRESYHTIKTECIVHSYIGLAVTAQHISDGQGRNHWVDWWGGGSGPPKIWTDHPNFFDKECDYRYVTDCSTRNWVYHPYFVLYSNLARPRNWTPPTLKTWLRPW